MTDITNVESVESSQCVVLRCYPLLRDWKLLKAHMPCNVVSLTGDVQWRWCTNPALAEDAEKPALTSVPAGVREQIPFSDIGLGEQVRFSREEGICYVKATDAAGLLWIQYVR